MQNCKKDQTCQVLKTWQVSSEHKCLGKHGV